MTLNYLLEGPCSIPIPSPVGSRQMTDTTRCGPDKIKKISTSSSCYCKLSTFLFLPPSICQDGTFANHTGHGLFGLWQNYSAPQSPPPAPRSKPFLQTRAAKKRIRRCGNRLATRKLILHIWRPRDAQRLYMLQSRWAVGSCA